MTIPHGGIACTHALVGGKGRVDVILLVMWGIKRGKFLACVAGAVAGSLKQITRHLISTYGGEGVISEGIGDVPSNGGMDTIGVRHDGIHAALNTIANVPL